MFQKNFLKGSLFVRAVILASFFCAVQYSGKPGMYAAAEEESGPETEALAFLKQDKPRRHLAARLYRAGAVYVVVIFIKEEVGGFKVYLPLSRELREAVFKIANEALVQAGFRAEEDVRQDTLSVWFK